MASENSLSRLENGFLRLVSEECKNGLVRLVSEDVENVQELYFQTYSLRGQKLASETSLIRLKNVFARLQRVEKWVSENSLRGG